MNLENENLENDYPSIELAYPIAIASFDMAARRLDIVDGRLQTILAFIVTVSAAVPSVASGRGIHFTSGWFYLALTLFIICLAIGTYARLAGELVVLSPTTLFNEWLGEPKAVFQKDIIHYAGKAFTANLKLIRWKWRCSVWMTILFALEVVALVVWVLLARS